MDAQLISAAHAARCLFNESPTEENKAAWIKANDALYDFQVAFSLGTTVTRSVRK